MADVGGRPIFTIDPKALMTSGDDETEFAKWDGVVEYEFTTLMKPTAENVIEYSRRYNQICQALEKVQNTDRVAELISLRHTMRRLALNGEPLILNVSPYTDAGAASLYGYVEGAAEKAKEDHFKRWAADESKVHPVVSRVTSGDL